MAQVRAPRGASRTTTVPPMRSSTPAVRFPEDLEETHQTHRHPGHVAAVAQERVIKREVRAVDLGRADAEQAFAEGASAKGAGNEGEVDARPTKGHSEGVGEAARLIDPGGARLMECAILPL